jgi:pyridoxamine 5'-phosphate oxidase
MRPEQWGGYLVRPEVIEFWQGRDSRMHDRWRYTRKPGNEGWEIERLAP